MRRTPSIRPDFVVDNQRRANEDPGVSNFKNDAIDTDVLNFGGGNTTYASRPADATDFTISDQDADTDNPLTIAFWINLNEASDGTYRFIWNSWYPFHVWYHDMYCGITFRDEVAGQSNQFNSPQVSSKELLEDEEGNWVHVVMAYTPETSNGANDEKVQFYKNGQLWGAAVVSPTDAYDHAGPMDGTQYLGSYGTSTTMHIKAKLSNFLFYNHDGVSGRGSVALTNNDAVEIYNKSFVHKNYTTLTKGTDIVGYYKCDDDPSGGIIRDHSGLLNHFTTVNGSITKVKSDGLKIIAKKNLPFAQRRAIVPGLSSLRTNPISD